MANFPGLELLYASIESQIKSNNDALICFIHWNLVQQGFKCIGQGDESSSTIKKSEILPTEWNSSQEEYVFRYSPDGSDDCFLLKGLAIGDTLLVNFMRMKDEKVTSLSLEVEQFTSKEELHNFEGVYKDLALLHQMIANDLIAPLKSKETQTAGVAQRSETPPQRQRGESRQQEREPDPLRDTDPLRDMDPLRQPHRLPGHGGNPEWGQPSDPFSVGRSDLDPFAGGGSGMLMDPFRGGMPHRGIDPGIGMPGRLPRGAVPPGARFDPIGPPRPGGPAGGPTGGFQGGPDPDHLPPPGYDDMYM